VCQRFWYVVYEWRVVSVHVVGDFVCGVDGESVDGDVRRQWWFGAVGWCVVDGDGWDVVVVGDDDS
jgi:hypothetical protein